MGCDWPERPALRPIGRSGAPPSSATATFLFVFVARNNRPDLQAFLNNYCAYGAVFIAAAI